MDFHFFFLFMFTRILNIAYKITRKAITHVYIFITKYLEKPCSLRSKIEQIKQEKETHS
jgi:hypothetical protein